MIYFTSDLHFNHNNILEYEKETRPFPTVEEINKTLIKNWNDTVLPTDTIYILGDFFMGELEKIEGILNQLNGKKILIRGNHDSKKRIVELERLGVEVKTLDYLTYKGKTFILCHYLITNQEFFNMIAGNKNQIISLYGHLHSNAPKGYVNGSYHVGVDTNDLKPVSIKQIYQESLID